MRSTSEFSRFVVFCILGFSNAIHGIVLASYIDEPFSLEYWRQICLSKEYYDSSFAPVNYL